MRILLSIFSAILVTMSGPVYAQEQAGTQADTQAAEQTEGQKLAQKYFDEFRGMVMIYYVDQKCDVLDDLALQAVLITQADRLDSLVEMGGATGDQLNEVMASIESQIAADSCDNVLAVPSIVSSYQLAEFYRDFYLSIWDRYIAAAAKHEATGGDVADFACGSHPFGQIKPIQPLTSAAMDRLKLRDDFSRMEAETTKQAADVRQVCLEFPTEVDGTPLVEFMTVAQAVLAATPAD